jgi:hypothetical protein
MGDPDLKLVTVFETDDGLAIALAKGLLSDAEIPFHVFGDEIGSRPGAGDSLIHRSYRVHVAADREDEARDLLRSIE